MNSIATIQNAEPQVRLLRARRRIYTQGKRLLSLQVFVTIGVPVIGAFSALVWPEVKGVVAFVPIPGEAAPHSGMMSPTDSEMISPTVPR